MTSTERRGSERVVFVAEVHYSIENVVFDRRSSDLSCGGIWLDDSSPPENGQTVVVEFDLEGRRIKTRGKVVSSEAPIGFGVMFEDTKPADLEAIARCVTAPSRNSILA